MVSLPRLIKRAFNFIGNLLLLAQDQFLPSRASGQSEKNRGLQSRVLRSLPVIGYFMAMMSVVDCFLALVPPRLQDPVWEISALGSIADHTWGILIGFGLVLTTFMDETIGKVKPIEIHLINLFRFFLILLGLVFILGIPLTTLNTFRVNALNQEQITAQANAKKEFVAQVEANLNSISDPRQFVEIAQNLAINLTLSNPPSSDLLRRELREKLPGVKEAVDKEAQMAITSKAKYQWKASLRTLLQLVIFSITNLFVWLKTRKLKTLLL